ncbi:hypothetical protein AMC99_02001 [Altererythrobacter epoxidivorans]|uniref:Uncharacterized protein n=1 Tax=Altererythrobacter epoxidivorans TaxID=361183 RepID=A0A0M4M940_9SPHN|nr:hypothetical protein AMC99_02001 [Altererythrobacter epoxidivorans]
MLRLAAEAAVEGAFAVGSAQLCHILTLPIPIAGGFAECISGSL